MSRWHVYVGGVTQDVWTYFPQMDPGTIRPAEGIGRFLFDDVSGSLQHVDTIGGDLFSPQYLELHPTLPILYAAEFARPGRLVSFVIHPDGRLTRQSTIESGGAMAIALSVHPAGAFAYVAHFGDGVLTACVLGSDGAVSGVERLASNSPPTSRSQLHHVRVTPKGGSLVVADFGCDEVVTHALEADGMPSGPIARVQLPAGSAPRHIELHPSGTVVYVVGEGDSMLYVLEAEDFVARRITSRHAVVPSDHHGNSSPSELHLHPDGHTLFVGVRHADHLTAYAVDGQGGATTLYHEPSLGRSPRTLGLDPAGRHVLVGNWHTNGITVFQIGDDRRLRPVGEPIEVHSPSSIVFVPAETGSS